MGSYMPTRRRFTKISSIWSSWWTHPIFVTRWLYLSATNPRPHCWLIYKSSYNFQMVHKLTEEENEMSDLKKMIYLWVELHKLKSIYFSHLETVLNSLWAQSGAHMCFLPWKQSQLDVLELYWIRKKIKIVNCSVLNCIRIEELR